MPPKDFSEPAFLPRGKDRLIDALFRHLRHDSIKSLMDCCNSAAQSLVQPLSSHIDEGYETLRETPAGVKYRKFQDVRFEELIFHETKGLLVRVSYACPPALRRGSAMAKSGILEHGMVVAIVGLIGKPKAVSVTFFEVHLREGTESMNCRGGNGLRASVQLSFAQRDNQDDVRRVIHIHKALIDGKFVLVDFGSALLAGFAPCLNQLQRQIGHEKLPFSDRIAPAEGVEATQILPPAYIGEDDFTFDFSSLQQKDYQAPLMAKPSDLVDPDSKAVYLDEIKARTTLDDGQALSLVECLTRPIALCVGPPGTGKSFLGCALVQTLLASQKIAASRKPLLLVCVTNHALDSFLNDLVKRGVKKIVRLGGGSKDAWTKPYSIHQVSRKLKQTERERSQIRHALINVEGLAREGTAWCNALSGKTLSWRAVREHLLQHYKGFYDQFAALDVSRRATTDMRLARQSTGFGYHCWAQGRDLESLRLMTEEFSDYLGLDPKEPVNTDCSRNLRLMLERIMASGRELSHLPSNVNVWSMSPDERTSLMQTWESEMETGTGVEILAEIHNRHYRANQAKKGAHSEVDLRCLEEQEVIGLTTTACAMYGPVLERVGMKVVICEEAGEVMEAHTLCTLFPTIEHAIFIGDPQQLRPHTIERSLSLETEVGQKYRLDESIFERLISPKEPGVSPVPASRLELQRRMHPEIADICRATLYPFLKDHDSTHSHPPVAGMRDRIWWLDHSEPEDVLDPKSPLSRSCTNSFEANMVAAFIRYLMRQDEYGLGDIAVLTPYNGQLALLTKALRSVCAIYLSDKDRAALVEDRAISEDESLLGTRTEVDVLNMLRVSTIDNFQGEEAKVVILTTVRSNAAGRVGFLKTENRINVACSRARDGFYVIGNAACVEQVDMWRKIRNEFVVKKKIGPSFRSICSRHPDRMHMAQTPSDFDSMEVCKIPCGHALACGHRCPESCHPLALHDLMKCQAQCSKVHEPCGHRCQRRCGEPCGDCDAESRAILPCGHFVKKVCKGLQAEDTVCSVILKEVELSCGHSTAALCSAPEGAACSAVCAHALDCGHRCRALCVECQRGLKHPACSSGCLKVLRCGHTCQARFVSRPRRVITQADVQVDATKANVRHASSPVRRSASMASARRCVRKNAVPAPRPAGTDVVIHRSVGYSVACHARRFRAPNLVGRFWNAGIVARVSVASVDLYTFNNAGKIVGMSLLSLGGKTPKVCPTCSASIGDTRRYEALLRVRELPKVASKMVCRIQEKLDWFERSIGQEEENLRVDFSNFAESIRPSPLAAKINSQLLRTRGTTMVPLQSTIAQYREEVVEKFQKDLLHIFASLGEVDTFIAEKISGIVQPAALRCAMLFERCRLVSLSDSLRVADHLMALDDPTGTPQQLGESMAVEIASQAQMHLRRISALTVNRPGRHLRKSESGFQTLRRGFGKLESGARPLSSQA
ncbi:MAG: hypothetical protein M1825_004069 [Sarcosagium campestre]|nr:MAG: hypothetical protein M1825_004069 [Sarcosagium campestre]